MTGFARFVTVILMAAIGLAAAPVAAQDDGVGFEDMPGLQQAVTRTFGSPEDRDVSVGTEDPRALHKPAVALMLTAVYSFDTEANATAAYQLLQTDMNATGFSNQPLELVPVTLPTAMEHTAATASDVAFGTTYDFTLAMAHEGTFVYTAIGITAGGSSKAGIAATLRLLSAGQVGAEPAALDPAGGSSGGLWGKVPTLPMMERVYRGIESVEDAAPFPA